MQDVRKWADLYYQNWTIYPKTYISSFTLEQLRSVARAQEPNRDPDEVIFEAINSTNIPPLFVDGRPFGGDT